jgi:type VI secretion system protein VasD
MNKASWFALAAILAASGCAKAPVIEPPPPVTVTITLTAGADVNPDAGGRASPLALRVYELSDATAFMAADFFALWNQEAQVMAATPAKRRDFTLAPNGTATVTLQLEPNVQQLGVAAAFRDIRNSNWRALVAVSQDPQAPRSLQMNVRAGGKTVTADIEKKEAVGATQ